MNSKWWVLLLLVATLVALWGVPTFAQSGTVDLTDAEILLLERAVAEGRSVTAEQAMQGVRLFTGNPDLALRVRRFEDSAKLIDSEWTLFILETLHEPRSTFFVRASDGKPYFIDHEDASNPSETPVLTLLQARESAVQFIQARYPGFNEAEWVFAEGGESDGGDYRLAWTRVLNEHGTRAPYRLAVSVNGATGQVIHCSLPPDRITGPTVPTVSAQQAAQIAAGIAPLDPVQVPLGVPVLQMSEDPFGIQSLIWEFFQRPAPTEQRPEPAGYYILVNAIDGRAGVLWPLGASPPARSTEALRRQQAKRPPVRLRTSEGKEVRSNAPPQVTANRVWVRAELLRGLGAFVYPEAKRLRARSGDRLVEGPELQAELRKGHWWVPLRAAAVAFGWVVKWDSKSREAVVRLPVADK